MPIDPITAVVAGSGLVQGLSSVFGQRSANKTNIQLAREQRQWDLDMWNRQNDYNNPEQLLSDFFIICWSAKWVGGDMHAMAVDPLDAKAEDDSKILQGLWALLDEADIVVGHNSRKFDIRR